MNKWVRRTSIALVTVALAGVGIVIIGKELGERKMERVVSVAVRPLLLRTSGKAQLDQGRYLYSTRGCADCHGASGAGKTVISTPNMLVVSPNITAGANSVITSYRDDDWVRTLRHGVKPDGRPIMIMPSEDYTRLTDDDVAAIIAYVAQLPAAEGKRRVVQLPVAVKVMYAFGMVRDPAELIDHTLPPALPVPAAVSVEHGHYVAQSCIGCHGAHLSGGRIPGSPPEWPAPANLTPGAGSAMQRYPTAESMMAMMKSGKRPDGTTISPVMPFGSLSLMTETDMRALHIYLQTLPPRATGGR